MQQQLLQAWRSGNLECGRAGRQRTRAQKRRESPCRRRAGVGVRAPKNLAQRPSLPQLSLLGVFRAAVFLGASALGQLSMLLSNTAVLAGRLLLKVTAHLTLSLLANGAPARPTCSPPPPRRWLRRRRWWCRRHPRLMWHRRCPSAAAPQDADNGCCCCHISRSTTWQLPPPTPFGPILICHHSVHHE